MQAIQAARRVARSPRNLSRQQFWAQHQEAQPEPPRPRVPQYRGWRPGDTPRPEVKADPNELSVQMRLF
jgi:hypothetical protein